MKQTSTWRHTPPSVTVWVTPSQSPHSLQIKRCHQLKRARDQGTQSPQSPTGTSRTSQRTDERRPVKMTKAPTFVIRRQEMASFFRLFDDDWIRDFLWVDCCCKLTDKYLLAMTFVYFKRARFTIAEYTCKNFFIALYLANTMEEDEEESKYEIFPWALGKNWRRRFPCFLRQRDKLWARIGYRAAVSRTCCKEVMAIWPSHFVWQRVRSEQHGGAQRRYGEKPFTLPRGRTASRVPCALCNRISTVDQLVGPSLLPKISPVHSPELPDPFTPSLALEVTPPKAEATCQRATETEIQPQRLSRRFAEEVTRESSCNSTWDTSMDWINEE